jgi:hypothetical protein
MVRKRTATEAMMSRKPTGIHNNPNSSNALSKRKVIWCPRKAL